MKNYERYTKGKSIDDLAEEIIDYIHGECHYCRLMREGKCKRFDYEKYEWKHDVIDCKQIWIEWLESEVNE